MGRLIAHLAGEEAGEEGEEEQAGEAEDVEVEPEQEGTPFGQRREDREDSQIPLGELPGDFPDEEEIPSAQRDPPESQDNEVEVKDDVSEADKAIILFLKRKP